MKKAIILFVLALLPWVAGAQTNTPGPYEAAKVVIYSIPFDKQVEGFVDDAYYGITHQCKGTISLMDNGIVKIERVLDTGNKSSDSFLAKTYEVVSTSIFLYGENQDDTLILRCSRGGAEFKYYCDEYGMWYPEGDFEYKYEFTDSSESSVAVCKKILSDAQNQVGVFFGVLKKN